MYTILPTTIRKPLPIKVGLLDIVAFVAPLLYFVNINLIGQLYLTDLVLTGILPVLIFRYGRKLLGRLPRTAIVLLILWLSEQIVTDLIRGSTPQDFLRGWAMIAFTLTNFCSLYLMLTGKPRRLILFTGGAALGEIISYFVSPNVYALEAPWKFGYGPSVSWFLVLCAVWLAKSRRLGRVGPVALLLLVAVINLVMDFRSAAGVAFLASFYIAGQSFRRRYSARPKTGLREMVVLGIIAIIGAWSVLQIYQYSAQQGWLGRQAQHKYELQTTSKYGLIIGGRGEILTSIQAIINSPIIGYGSWPKDCNYALMYNNLMQQEGFASSWIEKFGCLIPTHSEMFGSWVQAGLLGAIFWLWVLTLPVRALVRIYGSKEPLAPLIAFFAFQMMWDILFSPFAGEQRILVPLYMTIMMNYILKKRMVRLKYKTVSHFKLLQSKEV